MGYTSVAHFGQRLVSVELARLGVGVVTTLVTLVGLLVGDGWSVSVLVGLVGDDLLAAIGQQHVVTAGGSVSVAGLHVAKVVARLVVLNVVLEVVTGRFVRLVVIVAIAG